MIISRQLTRLSLAGVVAAVNVAATAQPTEAAADIRRTRFGVPHIRADNERGLGRRLRSSWRPPACSVLPWIVAVTPWPWAASAPSTGAG